MRLKIHSWIPDTTDSIILFLS